MSVHSNHYDDPEEYERDLKYEYRKEQYEQSHGPIGDIPFYKEPNRCEECEYCMAAKIRKPTGRYLEYPTYTDTEGGKVIIAKSSVDFEDIWMCTNELSNKYMTEISEDDIPCRKFEWKEDE